MYSWKYCTVQQCREMLLSFNLLGDNGWTDDKVIACLYTLSRHAEKHYSQVKIPKKNGGTRTLLVPDMLLKTVQRNILHHILDGCRPADSAAAYHKNASLEKNASLHTGKRLVLKLDIRDFFGSITFPMVLRSAFPSQYYPPAVGTLLTALCCYRDRLPQGGPASPAISNLVMRPFDRYMEQWCGERNITYSRYCDDMTFSGDFDAAVVKRKVYGYLRAMGFEPNRHKTKLLSQGSRQTVTGIVVNDKPQVSRDYRRNLRREIYYCEKYGVRGHLEKIRGGEEAAKGAAKARQYPAEGAAEAGQYPAEGQAGTVKYLQALLGRISYVLQINPADVWFAQAKVRVEALLKEESGRYQETDL